MKTQKIAIEANQRGIEIYQKLATKDAVNEKEIRLKYVRGLEKFARSNISYLKDPSFEFEIFQKRVKRRFEVLEKIESIRLNATYSIALENYVNLILGVLHVQNLNSEEKKETQAKLLKEANLLHKEKNTTTYKKDKHKKSSFNDEY